MRSNEQNRIASYSSTQFVHLNFQNSMEKENFAIRGEVTDPFGISLSDIKQLKNQISRS